MITSRPSSSDEGSADYSPRDFGHSPLLVFYEVTRACDLVCLHCRACAQVQPDPSELSPVESRRLIDQLTEFPKPPMLVLTGGDPLKRSDIYDIVEHAAGAGLDVSVTPSATPLATEAAIRRLRDAGVTRLAISLDGADAATHDGIRGVRGSFDRVLEIMSFARSCKIPVQVNTSVLPINVNQIDALAELLARERIVLWSLFFIVPVGRATEGERLSPQQYEDVFERLWRQSQQQPFAIKTTEAMHYRRYVMQRRKEHAVDYSKMSVRYTRRTPLGINDGKGVMFVSHSGLIHPSGFMPIVCGAFPHNSVVRVYQSSPVFRRLRDANRLEGRCGVCEYRTICGGSRARAYALTGNPFAEEPDCVYIPQAMRQSEA